MFEVCFVSETAQVDECKPPPCATSNEEEALERVEKELQLAKELPEPLLSRA